MERKLGLGRLFTGSPSAGLIVVIFHVIFLHHFLFKFSGKNLLEVGSGTALASIVASICGAK